MRQQNIACLVVLLLYFPHESCTANNQTATGAETSTTPATPGTTAGTKSIPESTRTPVLPTTATPSALITTPSPSASGTAVTYIVTDARYFDYCHILNGALGIERSLTFLNTNVEYQFENFPPEDILIKNNECEANWANYQCIVQAKPKLPSGETLYPCFELCTRYRKTCNNEEHAKAREFCQNVAAAPTEKFSSASSNTGCFGTAGNLGTLSSHAVTGVMEVLGWTSKTTFLNQADSFLSMVALQIQNGVTQKDVKLRAMCMQQDCSTYITSSGSRRLLANEISLDLSITVPPEAEIRKLVARMNSAQFVTDLNAALTATNPGLTISIRWTKAPEEATVSSANHLRSHLSICFTLVCLALCSFSKIAQLS